MKAFKNKQYISASGSIAVASPVQNADDSILVSDAGLKTSSMMSHREGSKFAVRSTTTDGVSRLSHLSVSDQRM